MCFNNWNNWNNWYNFQNVSPEVNAGPTTTTSFSGNQNATFALSSVAISTFNGFDETTNNYGYYYYEPLYATINQANVGVQYGTTNDVLGFNFGSSGYSATGGQLFLNGTAIGTYSGLGTSDITIVMSNDFDSQDYANILSDITYKFTGTDPGTLPGGSTRAIEFTINDSAPSASAWQETVSLIPGIFGGALSGGIANGGNATNRPFESTGTATFANPDGASVFVAGKIAGAHGTLILQADGAWDYVLNPNDAAVQALGVGQTLSENFQIQATDGATSAIAITIEGSLTINGTSSDDTIKGTANGDHIVAGTGNETLNGLGGNDTIVAGSGSDVLNGGDGNDILVGGTGVDKINGNDGDDTIVFTNDLVVSDRIDGGTGTNTLVLDGDYSAGLSFSSSTVVNIQDIEFVAGNNYKIATADGTVAAGQTLTVDGSTLLATDSLTFNGSKETDGSFVFVGGAGTNVFTGGAGNDIFNMTNGGTDTLQGGAGNDTFAMGALMTAADRIDGGTGNDVVVLNGDYSVGLKFASSTMVNIETLQFTAGHNYNITSNDANVAAGQTLTVDASGLLAGDSATFNGSKETDGSFIFLGGVGTNVFTGGAGNDIFNMANGGADNLQGGAGNDTFNMGALMTMTDRIDGGTGDDLVVLNGDYSAGLKFSSSTMVNIETLQFAAGHSYSITSADGNVAAGQTLTVDASGLLVSDSATFNGSKETDGSFIFQGGVGTDIFTGGAGNDIFNMASGGTDTLQGGAGNDTFNMGASMTAADKIDGGTGNDIVSLDGDYSAGLKFGSGSLANVETISLTAGFSYKLTTNDANVAAAQSMKIDGSLLGASDVLTFNGAAETNGALIMLGGAGNDSLAGGTYRDVFDGGGGADTLVSNGGVDAFVYNSASDSTSTGFDTISGFNAAKDAFQLPVAITAVDAAITTGSLSKSTFDTHLTSEIGAAQLGAYHAVLFTPNGGSLAGDTFLIIDLNGIAGYQSGQDLVIELTSGTNLASLSTADFTT